MSRRDISNEIIVALAAIAMLALALTFGIVLTISNRDTTPVPPTGQALAENTQTPAPGITASATLPPATASLTPSLTLGATTPAARTSPTSVPTVTPVTPSSATPRPTRTASATPTAAPPSPTPSPTPSQRTAGQNVNPTPTATGTRGATLSRTATATRVQPSATPTSRSQAATPTRTRTATATTRVILTATATATQTATPTRTPSPTRTASATTAPSSTPTRTTTLIPTITTAISFPQPTPTLFIPTLPPGTPRTAVTATPACTPREDWVSYTVQQGDTLFSIARQAGVRLGELQAANCIVDASRLVAGQIVQVPPGAVISPRTPIGTPLLPPPALPGLNARDCDNPAARIVSPAPGAVMTGPFTAIGTANISDFSFYKLEMRPDDGSATWYNVGTYPAAVEGGVLGRVDTSFFPAGIYWLQLTVVATDSNYPPPCAIRLVISK